MKTVRLVMLATALTTFVSCKKERITGHGPVRTETRAVTNFAKIHTLGATDVFCNPGTDFKVEVSGYSNLILFFETNLLNDKLTLGYRDNVKIKNDNVKVYITLPVLKGLSISGSGNINTTGTFGNVPAFETNIYGSGNIHYSNGSAQNYFSTIAGSGNVYYKGNPVINAHVSGSGAIIPR